MPFPLLGLFALGKVAGAAKVATTTAAVAKGAAAAKAAGAAKASGAHHGFRAPPGSTSAARYFAGSNKKRKKR